jgi:hypothetical protein
MWGSYTTEDEVRREINKYVHNLKKKENLAGLVMITLELIC